MITLITDDDNINLNSKEELIELAQRELKEDIEVNDGDFESLPNDYPREITTYNESVWYLTKWFEGRYLNIKSLELE